ncbi:bifunctional adenosylcobinamide kinase/adenosylcobinamide-phosphate guanylyltransferase [Anaerobacillus isosaccharinicus]|uniref:Bifunctional adenosylcobinamide kinase/adenosylcobinamide-phosphate guanylyltransferase n=1 Tax=Anaerobacillus isosaccharinicus TaxID=1532552 RepID=A0A1S2M4D7_9BACI|nr:bifunctional adenosylcobinamide kinase/adenosylcobinamide-phosphate guanylyltransferase [Anaerobacillus isosaccharinicus]MBA5585793.1 bifunctional adenosylcobinamide kinase/adenosylcobinamide-phosphate guanylyltransferase [Anaerobacillus isosaccharinicus]QOY35910.1 bifunctional adenosylcobinamide kinase/adenosylcobinamide-phosphate guanylyltransferase [Anaerobacillus isosaccharinicus]
MHFITGGAFHGKKNWVIKNLQLNDRNCQWLNGYQQSRNVLELNLTNITTNYLVIEGVEQVIIELIKDNKLVLPSFQNWLQNLLVWEEQGSNRNVIIIGTDIGKGVVPIEKQQRLIRDEVGRCFQELTFHSAKVSLIWYGLQQVLKE